MKFNLYISSLLLITVSACAPQRFQYKAQINQDLQKISIEIENSTVASSQQHPLVLSDESGISTILSRGTTTPKAEVTKDKILRYATGTKGGISLSHPNEFNYAESSLDQPTDEEPKKFDKDNVFWKIGRTLIRVGGGSFAVFGGLFLSLAINRDSGYFFLSGIIVSLAFVLLSIPFFLIGIIAEIMKRNAKPPIEDPNEI